MGISKSIRDFVEFLESKEFENACVEYTYRASSQGYSRLKDKRYKQVMAHRFSYCWSNAVGVDKIADLCVMHSCDNPCCVNPKHLSVGTWAENNKDRAVKGRTVVSSSRRKLSQEQIAEIKRRYNPKRDKVNGVYALSKEFGVDSNVIYKAVRGEYDWEGTKSVLLEED